MASHSEYCNFSYHTRGRAGKLSEGKKGRGGMWKMGTEEEELIPSEFLLQLELSVLSCHASIILLKSLFHVFHDHP